jgi:hypothetical protein
MSCAETPALGWRKSSYSDDSNCVEVAFTNVSVLVRDSKHYKGPVLSISHPAWTGFIAAASRGDYDITSTPR